MSIRQHELEIRLVRFCTTLLHVYNAVTTDNRLTLTQLLERRPRKRRRADPCAWRYRIARCNGVGGAHVVALLHTTSPPTIVIAARPRSSQPVNGVLRLFDRNVFGSTVHATFGSITETSATAPRASVPP